MIWDLKNLIVRLKFEEDNWNFKLKSVNGSQIQFDGIQISLQQKEEAPVDKISKLRNLRGATTTMVIQAIKPKTIGFLKERDKEGQTKR